MHTDRHRHIYRHTMTSNACTLMCVCVCYMCKCIYVCLCVCIYVCGGLCVKVGGWVGGCGLHDAFWLPFVVCAQRTLAAFYELTGVNFASKDIISDKALSGGLPQASLLL